MLYRHSPLRLHGLVLNSLRGGTTVPLSFLPDKAHCRISCMAIFSGKVTPNRVFGHVTQRPQQLTQSLDIKPNPETIHITKICFSKMHWVLSTTFVSVYIAYALLLQTSHRNPISNSMQRSPSWEANSCPATQNLPSIFWNPKELTTAGRWARCIQPISVISILIIPSHLRLRLRAF
jgi:hypothetical protein